MSCVIFLAILAIISKICVTFNDNINCPDDPLRSLRAKAFCQNSSLSYVCLNNTHTSSAYEECIETDRLQFTPLGQKFVWTNNRRNVKCTDIRFQPFALWENVSSDCVYLKSLCVEEGQLLDSNDMSTMMDWPCRCDYNKGYSFVLRPKNKLICRPSEEDCTCFINACPVGEQLSSNYSCVPENGTTDNAFFPNVSLVMKNVTGHRELNPSLREENTTPKEYATGAVVTVLFLIVAVAVIGFIWDPSCLCEKSNKSVLPSLNNIAEASADLAISQTPLTFNNECQSGISNSEFTLDAVQSDREKQLCQENCIHVQETATVYDFLTTPKVTNTWKEAKFDVAPDLEILSDNLVAKTELFISVLQHIQHVEAGCACTLYVNVPHNSNVETIEWLQCNGQSETIINISKYPEKYSGGTTDTPYLTIKNLVPNDGGTYKCRVKNRDKTCTSDTLTLVVNGYPPRLDCQVLYKRNEFNKIAVFLKCNIIATPKATEAYCICRHKNGIIKQLQINEETSLPSLSTYSVEVLTSGEYTFLARNVFGEGRVTKVLQHISEECSGDTTHNCSFAPLRKTVECKTEIETSLQKINPLMKKSVEIIAALDIGTTYTRYAFMTKESFYTRDVKAINKDFLPTRALFKKTGEFVAFGNKADNDFSDAKFWGDAEHYKLFENFMIEFYRREDINASMEILNDQGDSVLALDLLTAVVKAVKDEVVGKIRKTKMSVEIDNIFWVLTVPDEWSDNALELYRMGCEESGIQDDNAFLETESTAASMYFSNLQPDFPRRRFLDLNCNTNMNYLLLDLGGGTCNMSVYNRKNGTDTKLSCRPSYTMCGERIVVQEFLDLIESIIGDQAMTAMEMDEPQIYLEWKDDMAKLIRSSDYIIKAPVQTLDKLCQLYMGKCFREAIDNFGYTKLDSADNESKIVKQANLFGDKLIISKELKSRLFSRVMKSIISEIQTVLEREKALDIQTFLIVGGFAESAIVKDAIRAAFSDKCIIYSEDMKYSLALGSLLCGFKQLGHSL